jgi:hypothetical protein
VRLTELVIRAGQPLRAIRLLREKAQGARTRAGRLAMASADCAAL